MFDKSTGMTRANSADKGWIFLRSSMASERARDVRRLSATQPYDHRFRCLHLEKETRFFENRLTISEDRGMSMFAVGKI